MNLNSGSQPPMFYLIKNAERCDKSDIETEQWRVGTKSDTSITLNGEKQALKTGEWLKS